MKKFIAVLRCALAMSVWMAVISSATAATFSQQPLDNDYRKQLLKSGQWTPECPVPLERLRKLTLSYYDFAGKIHNDGELIVMDAVASDVITIFKKLYSRRFPIAKIRPISEYQGNDDLSMADNNTASFSCRTITGGGKISIHAYGLAIDVNTIQNPYISFSDDNTGTAQVLPHEGISFLNRHNSKRGMVEPIVKVFAKEGFNVWGGRWTTPIDFQHFQPTRFIAEMLASLPVDDAKKFFIVYKHKQDTLNKLTTEHTARMLSLYKKNPKRFIGLVNRYTSILNRQEVNVFIDKIDSKLG